MSIGPRFALFATAPAEWNEAGLIGENQVCLRSSTLEAFVVEIFSRSFREQLRAATEAQWVFIAEIIREDANLYYAFESPAERALFIELRDLDSIGPKTAALALAGLGRENLLGLLRGQLVTSKVKISGVGPKTLDKLAAGLKGKEEKFMALLLSGAASRDFSASKNRGFSEGPMPPAYLLPSLERLGLRAADTLTLYRELLLEIPDIAQADSAKLVRLMLQRWGQHSGRISPGGSA